MGHYRPGGLSLPWMGEPRREAQRHVREGRLSAHGRRRAHLPAHPDPQPAPATPPPRGAHLRYLATTAGDRPIAAISFAASAWAREDRDNHIGWSSEARQSRLHLVVGNPRFLVAPWVHIPHLASHLLGSITHRLRRDWQARYGYQPLLIETFVEVGRHAGTCYQAANWLHVGQTKGRGKLDRYNKHALPIKDIYLYPLQRNYQHILTAPA